MQTPKVNNPDSMLKRAGKVTGAFRKLGDPDDRFDIEFWQAQGDEAILRAAWEMVLDSIRIKTGENVEPRLDRSAGSFQKM